MSDTRPSARIPGRALFIVGNEACERLSYYGMSSVLTLYMVRELGMHKDAATTVAHNFKAAVYFLPLLGALIADRWLGRYRTILTLSLFYCLGHLALAVFEGTTGGLYLGLALIAFGAGGIKPCVSAFIGDQFDESNRTLLAKAYSLFYWAINFGSFFAFALIPWVRDQWGYSWAFGIPGIFMGIALLIFFAGSRTYTQVPPAGRKPGLIAVTGSCLFSPKKELPFWERARHALDAQGRRRFDDELIEGCRRTAGVIGLFSVIPVFWALFDQTNTTWVLQGERMTPVDIPLPFLEKAWKLDAESIQTLNPALVMLLIPIMTYAVYPLAERLGLSPKPLRRMSLGLALAAFSFATCAGIQWQLEAGARLSIAWQAIPYLILTSGEVLFSTTGLEFAFTQAPKSMKSTLMSFWLLTASIGNLLVAEFAALNGKLTGSSPFTSFVFFSVLMGMVTILFTLLARRYARKNG